MTEQSGRKGRREGGWREPAAVLISLLWNRSFDGLIALNTQAADFFFFFTNSCLSACVYVHLCVFLCVYVTPQGLRSWGPCATSTGAAPSVRKMELVPPSPSLMSWAMCKSQHSTCSKPHHPDIHKHTHTYCAHTHTLSHPCTASFDQQKPSYQETQGAADTGAKHNKVKNLTFNNMPAYNTLLHSSRS